MLICGEKNVTTIMTSKVVTKMRTVGRYRLIMEKNWCNEIDEIEQFSTFTSSLKKGLSFIFLRFKMAHSQLYTLPMSLFYLTQ